MPKVIYYVAASLDGHIADSEGGVDWLNQYELQGNDYGYAELYKGIDAVVMGEDGLVKEIQVKKKDATSHWIWGAFGLPGRVLGDLQRLWLERERRDEYVGTLVNEYIGRGGIVRAVKGGQGYVDVGTLHGYREAIRLLDRADVHEPRAFGAGMQSVVASAEGRSS